MSTTGATNNADDTTDNGNEVVYTAVFILLFLPPLIMLLVQLQRSISYGLHRKFFEKLIWVKSSDKSIERRINIHFLLKASFTLICLIRIVQAFVFLGVVLAPGANLGMDNAIRYWIPYIAMNFMFTCICFLLYYWVEMGLVTYGQLGKVRVVPLKFTWGFVVINAIFHILTIVVLPIYIKPELQDTTPQGSEQAKTFRKIYLYAVNIPQLVICILGSIFVKYTMQRLKRKINLTDDAKTTMGKAFKRVEIFTAVTAVVFAIRIILNSLGIYVSVSGNVDFEATLEFFWNSIPEVSLSYALAWLLWIKRSHVRASSYKELPQDAVAPELVELTDDKNGVDLPEVKA